MKVKLQIINARTTSGNEIDKDQQREDRPKLVRLNNKFCKDVPLWDVFGGDITIEDRVYQVCSIPVK